MRLQLGNLCRPNRDLAILDVTLGRQLGVLGLQGRFVLTESVDLLERGLARLLLRLVALLPELLLIIFRQGRSLRMPFVRQLHERGDGLRFKHVSTTAFHATVVIADSSQSARPTCHRRFYFPTHLYKTWRAVADTKTPQVEAAHGQGCR